MGASVTYRVALPVAIRANVVRADQNDRSNGRAAPLPWPPTVLILDTECALDPAQRLTFGSYWIAQFGPDGTLVCLEQGLFHDDELERRDPAGYACLCAYRKSHRSAMTKAAGVRMTLLPRRQFVNSVLWRAIESGSLIVGYNLAFDLTRLGVYAGEARGLMFDGGFSVSLFEYWSQAHQEFRVNKYRPWFRFKTIDGKRALLGLARRRGAPKDERKERPEALGRLLDLQHLAFALTDRKLSLRRAAETFGLTVGKLDPKRHGVITPDYIDYNRRDVEVTARLLEAVRAEFDRHPVALSPDRVLSPAGIGKGYLRAMGMTPPALKFALTPTEQGQWMTTYFGGRSEVRVRRVPVPVVYVDFLSMYPTVNSLMGLWDLLTARTIRTESATKAVRALLAGLTVEQCFDPNFWRSLRFIARVGPRGEPLPVRAPYNEATDDFAIGLNPLTSAKPLWVAGPDLGAGWLQSGRVPEVLEAIRLVPQGQQADLQPVSLRGQLTIDPRREDFFRRVIELRQELPGRPDLSADERERLDRFLKVLANSSSYGIYAEFNRQPVQGKEREDVMVYGLDGGFPATTTAPEEPGEFSFPAFATLTTAGARLMLALLERSVRDAGGTIAFGDTDSAAIVATRPGGLVACPGGHAHTRRAVEAIRALSWTTVHAIVDRFATLNLYDPAMVPGSILKIEDVNHVGSDPSKKRRQLFAYAISAKRYALFTKSRRGDVTIVDAKEHGLGHLLNPIDQDAEDRDWVTEVWRALVREALGHGLALPDWTDRPAVIRLAVSSPTFWRTYAAWNQGKAYGDQVKPANFGLSVIVAPLGLPAGVQPGDPFHLLGVYEPDPAKWLDMEYFERYSGRSYRIGVGRSTSGARVQVRTIRDVIQEYRVHPEPKSLDASGKPCDRTSVGLLQPRPVELAQIVYLGKEANALDAVEQGMVHRVDDVQTRYLPPGETGWNAPLRDAARRAGARELAAAAGVQPRSIFYFLAGTYTPAPETLLLIRRAVARRARNTLRCKQSTVEDRQLAQAVLAREHPGLDSTPVPRRGRGGRQP